MTEYQIEYVDEVPRAKRKQCVYSELVSKIGDEQVIKVTLESPKKARSMQSSILSVNRQAIKRGSVLPYPGIRVASRGNLLFLWREP